MISNLPIRFFSFSFFENKDSKENVANDSKRDNDYTLSYISRCFFSFSCT